MATTAQIRLALRTALRDHWPEYLIEAAGLGTFMVVAGTVATALEYPGSALHQAIGDADVRRVLAGIAMGLTAMALTYSPWGQRSGAHFNPALTLTFWRLGKVAGWDAVLYVAAQCAGGLLGVLLVGTLLHEAFTAPPVRYAATLPQADGVGIACAAEVAISAMLMWVVLRVSNDAHIARYTGVCAGVLVALFISVEAPLSGMSMNPARSLASAAPAGLWMHLWIYALAPVFGMQAAAAVYQALHGRRGIRCAKLLHPATQRCIHCGYEPVAPTRGVVQLSGEL